MVENKLSIWELNNIMKEYVYLRSLIPLHDCPENYGLEIGDCGDCRDSCLDCWMESIRAEILKRERKENGGKKDKYD